METKPTVPRAIFVGIQVPSVGDIAHAAGIEELSRLVKTLGYEVVGTMSQKRDELDGATVLGKGVARGTRGDHLCVPKTRFCNIVMKASEDRL
jgi:GTP-binding GTPase N-terminal